MPSFLYQFGKTISLIAQGAYPIAAVAILIAASYIIPKLNNIRNKLWFTFIMLIATGISCDILKIIFGRARPEMWFDHHLYGFYWFITKSNATFWSFPSGHSTTIATLATCLALFIPKTRVVCVLLAISVAAGRIFAQDHYLSDVMAGLWLGWVLTLMSYYYVRKCGKL